jgi:hypothetical protein
MLTQNTTVNGWKKKQWSHPAGKYDKLIKQSTLQYPQATDVNGR